MNCSKVSGTYKTVEKKTFFCFFRWSQMVPTQCDSLGGVLKVKVVENKREETAGLSMAMRFPVQCSACQSGETFKTNAGKRLCCAVLLCCIAVQWSAVLWSAVLCCCAVECCAVLLWGVCGALHVGRHFFLLIFSRKTHYLP